MLEKLKCLVKSQSRYKVKFSHSKENRFFKFGDKIKSNVSNRVAASCCWAFDGRTLLDGALMNVLHTGHERVAD
jgi:hypothetical protein